jgi:hypothetical protein
MKGQHSVGKLAFEMKSEKIAACGSSYRAFTDLA